MTDADWRLVAVRGATTADEDTPEQIRERTAELLEAILERNGIGPGDIVSIIFTATPDLISDFPAAAARGLGLSSIPLICSQEIPVKDGMERCVRVMLHAYSRLSRDAVRHVYLHEAKQLRTDLPE